MELATSAVNVTGKYSLALREKSPESLGFIWACRPLLTYQTCQRPCCEVAEFVVFQRGLKLSKGLAKRLTFKKKMSSTSSTLFTGETILKQRNHQAHQTLHSTQTQVKGCSTHHAVALWHHHYEAILTSQHWASLVRS